MEKSRCNGIIFEDIKIGDIHYEFFYDKYVKVKVLTTPIFDSDSKCFSWKSIKINDNTEIDYTINIDYLNSIKLYNYMAYHGCKEV